MLFGTPAAPPPCSIRDKAIYSVYIVSYLYIEMPSQWRRQEMETQTPVELRLIIIGFRDANSVTFLNISVQQLPSTVSVFGDVETVCLEGFLCRNNIGQHYPACNAHSDTGFRTCKVRSDFLKVKWAWSNKIMQIIIKSQHVLCLSVWIVIKI